MSDQSTEFYVAETAEGKFVAYTTRAPYFCFVEDSEDAAIAIADRALDLVARIDVDSFSPKSVSHTITELAPKRVIRRDAHAPA